MTSDKLIMRGLLTVAVLLIALMPLAADSPAEKFFPYSADSNLSVDHSPWAGILDKYLDADHPSGINRFDYKSVTPSDRRALDDYVESLQSVDVAALNRDEQMAYWINFYNALTVKVILDHYPVDSIRDISLPGSRGGPWKAALVTVKGTELSLDDIEHGILRPIWKDPRIHYAVNCASIGCPNLADQPYEADRLEEMLDNAARGYVNHPRGVGFDGRRITLSSIYNWYNEDFGDRNGLMDHLLKYADSDTADALRGYDGRFRYDYNWELNQP